MKYDVMVDGVSLNTGGTGVVDITGLGAITGRDYHNTSTYGRDGEASVIGGFTASTFGVEVLVDGTSIDTGVVPEDSSPEAEAWANLQWLSGLFASDYLLEMSITMPGRGAFSGSGMTLLCQAQLLTMSTPKWSKARDWATVTLGFTNPDTYFRPLGGGELDAQGWRTINVAAGTTALTLPTSVFHMNGFIEDAQFKITNANNAVKTVSIKALNRNAGLATPEFALTSTRANGVLSPSGVLDIDCKTHTALHTAGGVTESMIKYANWVGGRPGSMLRIGQPYQLQLAFTPYTGGASMSGISWQIKYRPSFI